MQLVQLPAAGGNLPQSCACCMRPTTDSTQLQYDETYHFGVALANVAHLFEIPYCGECEAHAIWHRDFGMAGTVARTIGMGIVASVVGGFAAAIALLLGAAAMEAAGVALPENWFGVSWAVVVAAVVFLVCAATWRYRTKRRPELPIGYQHASKKFAAALVEVSDGVATLVLLSEPFVESLLRVNPDAQAIAAPPGFVARPDKTPIWQMVALAAMITLAVLAYLGVWK